MAAAANTRKYPAVQPAGGTVQYYGTACHLWPYTEIPKIFGGKLEAIQAELTAVPGCDPPVVYFCALGFTKGYMGMQVFPTNKDGKSRQILFSVWDDAKAKKESTFIYSAPDVVTGRFAGEGTGCQTKFYYDWKTGEPQRFLVRSSIHEGNTAFSGYYYMNNEWKLLATVRHATDTNGNLAGIYSFCENWYGKDISQPRRCLFGPYFGKSKDSDKWIECTKARFTRSDKKEPVVWDGGVEGDKFFMQIDGPESSLKGHKPDNQEGNFVLIKPPSSQKAIPLPLEQTNK